MRRQPLTVVAALLMALMALMALVALVACGGGVEEADESTAASESTTTLEATTTTTTTEATTTTTEAPSSALTPEDEAACRYMLDEVNRPGNYDPTVVFPTMADMATDGGEVEAAANDALTGFQQSGSVEGDTAVDLMSACISVVGD